MDEALRGRKNMVGGANREGFHLRNLTPDVTFQHTGYADLRTVGEGEGCPNCGQPLKLGKTVEIGHIFKLGYKYSDSMGARVLDKDGKEITPIMGSYGIGIERILTSVIEQNHDENGFWLPPRIAPFEVIVVPTNVADAKLASAARRDCCRPGEGRVGGSAGRPRRASRGQIQGCGPGRHPVQDQCGEKTC